MKLDIRGFLEKTFPYEKVTYDGFYFLLLVCIIFVAVKFCMKTFFNGELVRIEKVEVHGLSAADSIRIAKELRWLAADSVNVNTSSTYELRKIGFSWYEISMILSFREAGYVFDSIADLRHIVHIDTAHLYKVGSRIVFDHDPIKKNIKQRFQTNKFQNKSPRHPRIPLFLADSTDMAAAGMQLASWQILKSYQDRYFLGGSIRLDTLTNASPDELKRLLAKHCRGTRKNSIAKASDQRDEKVDTSASIKRNTSQSPTPTNLSTVELNSATQQQLEQLPYVKEKTAKAIVDYREKLGGYVDISQLKEVWAVGDRYEKIAPHVIVDTTAIRKINVNSANDTNMRRHPYFSKRICYLVRKTQKSLSSHGKSITPEDMQRVVRGEELSIWFWSYVGYE